MIQSGWFLVLNPASGSGRAGKSWPLMETQLKQHGIDFTLYRTGGPNAAVDAVKRAIEEQGFTKILVIGGDGTLSEVANGILSQKRLPSNEISLGLIPAGTGNDWGRTWSLPESVSERIKLMKEGFTALQDAALIKFESNGITKQRWFMNLAGCGFDAKVAAEVNKQKEQGKSGLLIYVSNLLKVLFTYKSVQSLVVIDEKKVEIDLYALTVGVCRYAGNKMNLLPLADPSDGLLDISLVRKIRKRTVIFNLMKLFNGKIYDLPEISHYRCKTLKILPQQSLMIHVDGESLGTTPAEVSIVPNALRVVVKR